MGLLLIILVIFLLFGGGFYGYRKGYYGGGGGISPVMLIVIVLVILVLFGGFGGHYYGHYWQPATLAISVFACVGAYLLCGVAEAGEAAIPEIIDAGQRAQKRAEYAAVRALLARRRLAGQALAPKRNSDNCYAKAKDPAAVEEGAAMTPAVPHEQIPSLSPVQAASHTRP